MTQTRFQHRDLVPGTSGWTASDLDDPRLAAAWDAGRYEIINGILKTMPPADFDHGEAVFELLSIVRAHLRIRGQTVRVSTDVDLVVDDDDVLRVDGMLVTEQDVTAQQQILVQMGRDTGRLGRVRVAPTLVIESVSAGHERHDHLTKRRIYERFGIPNYWIVDAVRRTLECLRLDAGRYRTDATGHDGETIRPSAFPGLEIRLHDLWER